jgi:hypothetical protein
MSSPPGAGGSQTDGLSERIRSANEEIVEAVRRTGHTPAWLRPAGNGDGRSAATVAHHIAVGYERGLGWAVSIKERQLMPEVSEARMSAENAEHAVTYAAPAPEATEELLIGNCTLLLEFVGALLDPELVVRSRNEVMGRLWTVEDVLETTIRHTRRHTEAFVHATRG